jgi:putative endonuclease
MSDPKELMHTWHVYIVRCSDNTLYTGVTKDLERRINEHNADDRLGARYTKSRRPVTLRYEEISESRSAASKREGEIKRLTKKQKESLIAEYTPSLDCVNSTIKVVNSLNRLFCPNGL